MSIDRNYSAWIEAVPHIVWIASKTGAITFLNRQWTQVTGLGNEQGLGFEFFQAIHPEDRDRIQSAWQEAVRSECPYEAKFRMRLANGAYCRIMARAQLEPTSDLSDAPQNLDWVGTFTNIESIVYCKDDLILKQQFLEALLHNLSDGIVACDATGTLTLFNAASQSFHGIPAQPLPPERWADYYDLYEAEGSALLAQKDIPLVRALMGERVQGAKMRIVPKTGKPRILVANGAPILHPDGHQLGAVVAMRDITAQEAAETALKNSERRFRAIFNQTFQFIGLLDPDGTLIEANQTALNFGGFTAEMVIGKPLWETPWWGLSQETRHEIQQAVAQAAAGEFVRFEVEVVGANDAILTIDFSLKPIHDEAGNVVLLIPEGRDITARKQAESEVHWLNARLEERVAERTAQLEAKNYQNELLLASEQEARAELEIAVAQLETLNAQKEELLEREQTAKAELEIAIAETSNYTERLTLALDAAQMGTWDLDMLTGQILWNPRHEIIFGYPLGTPKRDYFDWERRVHPEDLEWVHQATHAARDAHQILTLQYRIIWPDGSVHWIDAKGRFFYDASDRPIRMIGVVRDITARKQTEEQLRESEERFRRAILDSPLPTILHAENGEVLLVNTAWTELSGYQPKEIPTISDWTEQAYGDQKGPAVIAINNLYSVSTRTREGEFTIRTRDGERRVWDFSSAPLGRLPDGRRFVISTALDVTERKQYEEALHQTQAQFRATFEQAAVGIAHVALEGRWLRVNQKLCDIVGYSAAELQSLTFQDITHPDDLETDLACMQQLLAGEIQTYSMEKRYFHKSGEVVWIELTVALVRAGVEEGQDSAQTIGIPQYFISVIEEINDRKQDQAELQARARELSNLNGLLAQATVLLEERNQELDRFVHLVSHDLKAPLRAISNLSQWIEEDAEGELSPENQQQMQLLRERVRRMETMISGLLDYAKAGRTNTAIETVSVAELLAEVVDSLAPPQPFQIEVMSAMPTFLTKRLLLSQVFSNLIGNAIKHHNRPNGLVRISSEDKGDFYEFSVADDGPGIESKFHDKVFMIFQTVNSKSNPDSSGIGLSIVKKIVETEEGMIRLESELGKGTTFYFTWPKQSLFLD